MTSRLAIASFVGGFIHRNPSVVKVSLYSEIILWIEFLCFEMYELVYDRLELVLVLGSF